MTKRTYSADDLSKATNDEAKRAEISALTAALDLMKYYHKKVENELSIKIGKLEAAITCEAKHGKRSAQEETTHGN